MSAASALTLFSFSSQGNPQWVDIDQIAGFVADKRQVTTDEVCAGIGIEPSHSAQTQIGKVLLDMGWRKRQLTIRSRRTRVYFR